VAYIADAQFDEVASAQLAVDPQIEQGKLSEPALHLKTDANCPDLLKLERGLLPDQLALVSRFPMERSTDFVHGDLLSVEKDSTLREGEPISCAARESD